MKNAKTEIKASFLIQGFDCTHDQITDRIGVAPSAVWRKGDQIGSSRLRRKEKWLAARFRTSRECSAGPTRAEYPRPYLSSRGGI
jgi:hypothetical protein